MKSTDRITAKTILIFTLLVFLSNFANAITISDGFRGGLVNVNSFFAGQQYQPYANIIDFVFFALFFIALYSMGARYAFKEMKRPERVIAVLLGLMTAFLLVLAGWSATVLLPYIHWIFYILLFAFWYWLLKGIKSKFWRFLLALLLTLLTIWLISLLLGGFIAPDTRGYTGPFFESLKGIKFPELPSAPGVPSAITDLFAQPSAPPTGPTTLPPTPTPTPSGGGFFDFFKNWGWLIILLLALLIGGLAIRRRRGRGQKPQPQGNIDEITNKIEEFINRKREAMDKIREAFLRKIELFRDATRVQAYLNAVDDPALLWGDDNRERLRQEKAEFLDILEEEFKLIDGLTKLREVEVEIYRIFDAWIPIISRARPAFANLQAIINSIRELIGRKISPLDINNLSQQGIIYLLELIFDVEKHDITLDKELEALLTEDNIQAFIQDKFRLVNREQHRLADYLRSEGLLIRELVQKITTQIRALNQIRTNLGGQPTAPTPPIPPAGPEPQGETPVQPNPTVHPPWPKREGKFDPRPPEDPVLPVRPVIPRQLKPEPTKYKDAFFDLSPWFMPIKNQERTSACAAFAGSAIVEFYRNIARDLKEADVKLGEDLSELFLWYNFRDNKQENRGIYNIEMTQVFDSIRKEGICFDGMWPWEPVQAGIPTKFSTQPRQEAYADALTPYPNGLAKQIEGWQELDPANPDQWVGYLKDGHPIFISINCDAEFKQAGNLRKNIYYNYVGNIIGGHAIVIVGFTTNFPDPVNPKNSIAAFKIRNSWGSNWGENGYIWVPYELLPQLLIIKPYVFKFGKGDDSGQKGKFHTLTLTPTNSTPNSQIEIIGQYHDAYGQQNDWIKIGKVERQNKRMNEILLEDTSLNEKFQAGICFFEYKNSEKTQEINKFKILKVENSQVSIKINNKEIPKSSFINEKVKKLQINEYTFDVKLEIKELDLLPREQYFTRFDDKILKFKQTSTIKIKATLEGNNWEGPLQIQLMGAGSLPRKMGINVPYTIPQAPTGNYGIWYVSGGPDQTTPLNPHQVKELTVNEPIEFVFDFGGTQPEPTPLTPEQFQEVALEIFKEMNQEYPNDSFKKIKPQIESKYKVQLVQIGPTYDKWKLAALKTDEFRGFLIPSLKNYYWPNWENLVRESEGTPSNSIAYLYDVSNYTNLERLPSIKNFILLPVVSLIKSKTKKDVKTKTEKVLKVGPPWNKGIISDSTIPISPTSRQVKPTPRLGPRPTLSPETGSLEPQIRIIDPPSEVQLDDSIELRAEILPKNLPDEDVDFEWDAIPIEKGRPNPARVIPFSVGNQDSKNITTGIFQPSAKRIKEGEYLVYVRLLNKDLSSKMVRINFR